jgi:HSP20 family protein
MKKSKQENKKKTPSAESKASVPAKRLELLPRWGEEFERMREDFFRRPFPEFWQPLRKLSGSGFPGLSIPVVDLFEEKDYVVVKAEMPGLEKKDVEVSLNDSRLTIKGEKKKKEEVKKKDYFYSERSYGAFVRVLDLPCKVKGDKVKASFENGVLEVKLPKSEEAKSRSIAVKID